MKDYAYYKSVFGNRPMPFAYVDLDLLEQNIGQVVTRAGGNEEKTGKRVRLASKSLRCVAITRRILSFDPCFRGLMCFTAREAVYLAGLGFDDLLLGYPAYNEQDIAAIACATAEGAHITLMVDCLEHVERVEKIARRHGVRLPLCLEVDMSLDVPGLHFGVWRSPLRTVEQARPVVRRILASECVWLDGLMGYEAQIAGVGDNFVGQTVKNTLVRQLKRRSIREVARRRAALVEMIGSYGVALRFVNGGGTGSIDSTRAEDVVTEVTVGSAFYAPALFDNYRNFRYQPAAGFAIEIVRHPQPSIYTCLGGGYVASGSAGPEKLPQPYLPQGAALEVLEGAGEVQTPIRYNGPLALTIGDPIFLRHSKAGELCERFTHLLLVQDGAVVDEVTTYRGDGQCFL
ncbi:MAG TPA: amino acid deaminase/aldolase [Ktedonobacteraceae bacterium]|jgi:D-serine deaminase-like pyridoxal phosphate-dependent protein|nr:amino acid deaminase/aldolase [Ktedonobacteraceae bacterium]